LAFAACVLLVGCAGPAPPRVASPTAVPLELAFLPSAASGTTVRVTGKIEDCDALDCRICPLRIPLDPRSSGYCYGISWAPVEGKTPAELDVLYSHSVLTVDAVFDPTCVRTLCLDRATVLGQARVVDRR
jgi:hypothetical protein